MRGCQSNMNQDVEHKIRICNLQLNGNGLSDGDVYTQKLLNGNWDEYVCVFAAPFPPVKNGTKTQRKQQQES